MYAFEMKHESYRPQNLHIKSVRISQRATCAYSASSNSIGMPFTRFIKGLSALFEVPHAPLPIGCG